MKRRLFFFLERLKITPAERKAVVSLLVALVLLAVLNRTLSSPIPYGAEDYIELEEQFKQRAAELKAREDQLMQRYFPVSEGPDEVYTARADTLPADSAGQQAPLPTASGSPVININTAGQETLVTLPGIGPVYARRIIEYRKTYGPFKDIEELKNIRGIAEKRLGKLKPFIKLTDSE